MSYPAYGDPIYLTDLGGGSAARVLTDSLGSMPEGCVLAGDVIIATDNSGATVFRVEADGTLTEGDSEGMYDPDTTGSSRMGPYGFGGPGYMTVDTAIVGGAHTLRKYVVNTSTLAITLQDSEPYLGNPPVINHLGHVVFSISDTNSAEVDHTCAVVPYDSSGFGTELNPHVDSTGLTGFDVGMVIVLAYNQYYTNHDRYFAVETTGGVSTDMNFDYPTALEPFWTNYFFGSNGTVNNYTFFVDGDGPDQLVLTSSDGPSVSSSMSAAGYDITDVMVIPSEFAGETWHAEAIWQKDGIVYLGFRNDDRMVGAITKDPFGFVTDNMETFFMRRETAITGSPAGFTSRGEIFTIDRMSATTGDYWGLFGYGEPEPPPEFGPCGEWVDHDLSDAVFYHSGGEQMGEYNAGVIRRVPSNSIAARFTLPSMPDVLQSTQSWDFEMDVTGDADFTFLYGMLNTDESSWDAGSATLYYLGELTGTPGGTYSGTIGPGLEQWDDAVSAGFNAILFFPQYGSGDYDIEAIRTYRDCVGGDVGVLHMRVGGSWKRASNDPSGTGRLKVQTASGTWKYMAPQPGENGGVGVGKIYTGAGWERVR